MHKVLLSSAVLLACLNPGCWGDELAAAKSKAEKPLKGLNGLYMGHSFFWPSVTQLKKLVGRTEIHGHQQALVRAGGRGGSPKSLWDSPVKRKQALKILDTKKVDVLVMTYFSPQDSSVEAYSRWIDYASEKNPAVSVMITIPWAPYLHRANDQRLVTDKAVAQRIFDEVILKLRKKYPDNKIIYCPYGFGVYELIDRLKANKLPGVKYLLNKNRKARAQSRKNKDQLLNDELGHAGELVTNVSAMIWLKTLYGCELEALKDKTVAGLPRIDCAEIAEVACQEIKRFNQVYQTK